MEERCRIADLRYKEVININTGARLGYAGDVEVNMENGKIISVVVPGALRFFGLLGREEEIVIPWDAINRIGEDIILVRHDLPSGRRAREKRTR